MKRAFALALLALGVAGTGCARERHEHQPTPKLCPCSDAGAPVDLVLVAFLSRARTAHHLADGFEERHETERAIDALRKVVDGPVPGGAHPPPEAREVLADTRARLADLLSQSSRFDDADGEVSAGLAQVPESGYFRGHLFEVRGLLEQRRAKALRAQGDAAAAASAEQRAVEASETSMEILAEVVRQAAPARSGSPASSTSAPTPQ